MPSPPHVGIQGVERGLGRAVPVPRPALAEGGKGGLWEQSCGGRAVGAELWMLPAAQPWHRSVSEGFEPVRQQLTE